MNQIAKERKNAHTHMTITEDIDVRDIRKILSLGSQRRMQYNLLYIK